MKMLFLMFSEHFYAYVENISYNHFANVGNVTFECSLKVNNICKKFYINIHLKYFRNKTFHEQCITIFYVLTF